MLGECPEVPVYMVVFCVSLRERTFHYIHSAKSPFGTIKSKKTVSIPLFMRVGAVFLLR